MRHQRTHDNFYTNLYKSANFKIPNMKLNNINYINKKSFQKSTSIINRNIEYICKEHNRKFYKYCLICKEDICPQCNNNNHFIHDTLKYKDISLNDEQMKLLRKEYKEYIDTFSDLLIKINQWKNTFNNAIFELEEYLQKNIIDVINKMINDYDINEINYKTIIEYRIIYSLLLENKEEKLNNQKLIKIMKSFISLKNYKNHQYIDENENLSSISKEIITLLNNSLNKGNFVQKGNNIIKFLFSNFSLLTNINKDNKNDNFKTIGGNYIKKIDKNDNYIYYNPIVKNNLNKSTSNIFESSRTNIRNLLFDNNNSFKNKNNKKIYERKKAFDNNKNGEIFLEKEELPIFNHKSPIQSDDNNNENININSNFINNNAEINFPKIDENHHFFESGENNPLWKSTNYISPINPKIISQMSSDNEEYDDFDDINIDLDYKTERSRNNSSNKRPIIFNNNINNFNNINNINSKNNYINTYNINKVYSERNKASKIYHHRKFNSTLIGGFKSVNLINKYPNDKNNENTIFNTIDLHNYETLSLTNTISLTDSKNSNTYRESIYIPTNKTINDNWKIKQVTEFLIDINKDINIGFELGNSECKIGIINQFSNTIELWIPYENEINSNNSSISTLISFKDKNENIIIGNQAEELKITNPSYSIFNFIKFIGKNTNEIDGKKELWPYKIYNNKATGRPYIKGFNNGYKNKIYNFEDLLSLYLRKLFELLFSKIKIKNENNNINNLININLVIAVPNNINYFQRKVIEKIFQTQLFPKENINNKNTTDLVYSFGTNKIKIKNIKIESNSNLGYLYLFQKQIENNFNKLNKNVLLIHIEGGSINISLISTLIKNESIINKKDEYDNKYEIKGITGTNFGEEDFTDNFIDSCLTDFTEKIRNDCIKTPSALAKLRKSFEMAKKYFYKKNQTEIKIQKLYDNIDLKMDLNKSDYEKSCNIFFQQITEIVKDLLIKTKITEKEIDDIIFIGNTTNVNIIKEKISKIFKGKNNELFNKLVNNTIFENDRNNNDIINKDYIVIGASLQSFNLYSNNQINKFKYVEITPISFGIEGLNKKMDFIIKRGDSIPKEVNKKVKISKLEGDFIYINIYEGENEYVYNNQLISSAKIKIKNFKNEKIGNNFIEILIKFIINSNSDLSVFILDTKSLKRKFECIINIDIVQGKI